MQCGARILTVAAHKFCDSADIFHQLSGIFKNIHIDMLQDIFLVGIGSDFERAVDMSVAEFTAADTVAVESEGGNNFFGIHKSAP